MLYPLKLKPVFKPKPWGGINLETYFNKRLPKGKIGESWEVCCRDDGMSIVEEGKLQGKTLRELIDKYQEKLIGIRIFEKYGKGFPLLIKLIDANDRLSVQVHPDDACAHSNRLTHGKDELWYIINAEENAKLIYGFKSGTSKKRLVKAVADNRVLQLLNEVTVKPGDFFSIPAGTVHAIGEGILIAEVQQNCNTTYRIYDWDRLDVNGQRRELQIPQALEAIHFQSTKPEVPFPTDEKKNGRIVTRVGPKVKDFLVSEVRLNGSMIRQSDPESFEVLINLKGHGKILYNFGCVDLYRGDTVLIPANLGPYCLFGSMNMLSVYMNEGSK